jgi:subtilase family serine protease
MRGADAGPRHADGDAGAGAIPRLRLTVALVVAMGMTLLAAPAAFALSSNYAIGVPICKAPTAGHASCFSIRRKVVSRTTAGARPFVRGAGVAPSVSTIGPGGGLTPADLATAYGFSSTATGTGQTVAIVDAYNDPTINADLQKFDTQYGLATCSIANACLKVVSQTGSTTALPPNDTTGWSVEESLDVEAVHSVCQKCKIILVEATSNSNANLEAAEKEAVTLKATEISNSFGGPETGSTATDEAAYNHPGIVITASAGDDGYFDWDFANDDEASANAPSAPASYSTVVAVGGTSLNLGQTATRQSETVWNDDGPKDYWGQNFGQDLGAGGGGCSTLIAGRPWQTHVPNWAQTVCGTHRLVSDVSAVADYLTGFDIYHSYNCGSACAPLGWLTIGGTSLSSPVIASMYALAGGAHGVSYPSLNLYGHLGTSSLYDVTVGGNGYCDGIGAANCGDPNTLGFGVIDCDYPASGSTPSAGDRACDALGGYDGPTGVGTPNGLTAFAVVHPTVKIAGPTTIVHNTNGTWTATVTDPTPGATVTSFKWNWGDGTAVTSTTTGSAAHKYTTAATRTITLTVTDSDGQTGTGTYTVKVT